MILNTLPKSKMLFKEVKRPWKWREHLIIMSGSEISNCDVEKENIKGEEMVFFWDKQRWWTFWRFLYIDEKEKFFWEEEIDDSHKTCEFETTINVGEEGDNF